MCHVSVIQSFILGYGHFTPTCFLILRLEVEAETLWCSADLLHEAITWALVLLLNINIKYSQCSSLYIYVGLLMLLTADSCISPNHAIRVCGHIQTFSRGITLHFQRERAEPNVERYKVYYSHSREFFWFCVFSLEHLPGAFPVVAWKVKKLKWQITPVHAIWRNLLMCMFGSTYDMNIIPKQRHRACPFM